MLIEIRFAFTGFDLASKRHNKSNKSNQLSISIHLEEAYNQMNFFCLQANGHITGCGGGGGGWGVYKWQLTVFALRFPIIYKKNFTVIQFFL